MNNIIPIKNVSFDSIIDQIDNYVNVFLKDGLLLFKQINISLEQQEMLSKKLAEKINCNYISPLDNEDHLITFNLKDRPYSKDELFIPWHLEHCEKRESQIACSWNMIHFSSKYGTGNTGFINSYNLFEKMPTEWKSFLRSIEIIDRSNKFPPRKCIKKHFLKNHDLIRLSPNQEDNLHLVNNRTPSKEENELFSKIRNWYNNQILNNHDIQLWWEWSQGDLLIVDLSMMIHAVKGGFSLGERIISRNWIFVKESDYLNQVAYNE